jgi:hypothetical protein
LDLDNTNGLIYNTENFALLAYHNINILVGCKILRTLISILTILFLTASCKTRTDKIIYLNAKFDTLPLPIDSATFYFKTKLNWQDTTIDAVDSFLNSWYSKMLFALQEPVLKNYNGDKEIYRFTWLRTFNHPVSVRLEKQGNIVKLFSKVCDGAGGYEPGKIIFDTTIILTEKQIGTTIFKLDNANFWTLQTEAREDNGKDGSEWIIEVFKSNKYHMVVRWTPEKGTAFRTIGEYLISISHIQNEMTGRDHGDY